MDYMKMHDQFGDSALHVMALAAPDGWLYLAEVVHFEPEGEVHTRTAGGSKYPSALSALAQGMAYARCIAAGRTSDN